jgi:hypothetical protein
MSDSRRKVRWPLIAIGGGLVVLLLGVIVLLSMFVFRDNPGARSVDDALDEFRTTGGTTQPGASIRRPPAGVYSADATGKASISFPPASQNYGAVLPITVTHEGDNCWNTEVDFNTAFRQTWHYCIENGNLTENGNFTTTRWDLGVATITNATTFECDPPGTIIRTGETAGQVSDYTCTGRSDSVDGPTTSDAKIESLGPETLTIGGVPVSTFHYTEVDTLTGSQRGTTKVDYWYSTDEFLLVHMARDIDIRTNSPVGDISYRETGDWQLASMVPQR